MHNVNEWTDRDGDLIGAAVFLTAEEVKDARKKGTIEITIENQSKDHREH